MDQGIIFLYTGDGRGKTTAALGQGLRACGHGWKVCMLQFMKGRDYGENLILHNFPGFKLFKCGRDEFVNPENPEKIDVELAQKGLQQAGQLIQSGEYQLVILDEINVALDFGLVSLQQVVDVITGRPEQVSIILTGRYAPRKLFELADTVTELKEIKHHYQKGIAAQRGIEY